MVQALEKYSVILNGKADKPATLDSSTLLRYSNPLGDVADGVLSVFGDPVAPFYTSSYRGDAGEATFLALLPKQ